MPSERFDLGTPYLTLEREGHLASRNALTATMYYGIKKAVSLVNGFAEPTALIITGTGDVFAPGGELRGRADDDNEHMHYLAPGDVTPFEEVRHSFQPVVSAVNGICQGGGLLIAMLSDMAVCSERATFRAPELLRGIADTGYAAYLPAHIGVARARDLLLTGRRLNAQEALEMGLIARVIPHDSLRRAAVEVAEDILQTAPEARMEVKRLLHERYGQPDRMSMEWSLHHRDEAREGMAAFAEKRSPRWVPPGISKGRRL
jgi:enoyl-CoA hydratase